MKLEIPYGDDREILDLEDERVEGVLWPNRVTTEDEASTLRRAVEEPLGSPGLDDFLRGRVPVDHRTKQPFGLLHGGVSVVLAESLGSIGAYYASPEGHNAVGLDINANHLRAATSGWVTGTARPVHLGRTTQVWQIEMVNDAGEMTCISRLTMAILAPR